MPYQPLTNEDSPLSAYPPYPFPQETFEVQQPAPQQQQQAQQQTQQKGTASECGRGNVVAIALFLLFSFGVIALIFHAAPNAEPIPRLQFVGEHDYVLAEDGSLTEKLTISQSGQFIHVYCNATELANRFCLDLKGHEASKFKFCADFTNETDRGAHSYIEILRKDGKYVKEQIVNPFEVFGNQGELGIYNRPAGLEGDLTGTLSGDLDGVRLFRVEGHSYATPFENALQIERGDRLDLALQPMIEVRDEAQIRAIFGQQNQPGAALLRKKRKSSTTSKRGESEFKSRARAFRSRKGAAAILGEDPPLGPVAETRQFKFRARAFRFRKGAAAILGEDPPLGFYAEKPTSNRTTSLLKPYSGPATFSYRYGGRTYFMPSTSCCGDEFHEKTVDVPKPKNVNITFTDGDGMPIFMAAGTQIDFSKPTICQLTTGECRFITFDLSVLYTYSDLLIYFNGQRFADFDHRGPNLKLDKMRIEGDVEILGVTKNGKTL
ncbi:unnamed protein product, partial [Mesorhabditis spiculigera]